MCDERSILLHVRCGGCTKMYQRSVAVPVGEDVPMDGEELVQSAFVSSMKFSCPRCEATYAEIVAFKVIEVARTRLPNSETPEVEAGYASASR